MGSAHAGPIGAFGGPNPSTRSSRLQAANCTVGAAVMGTRRGVGSNDEAQGMTLTGAACTTSQSPHWQGLGFSGADRLPCSQQEWPEEATGCLATLVSSEHPHAQKACGRPERTRTATITAEKHARITTLIKPATTQLYTGRRHLARSIFRSRDVSSSWIRKNSGRGVGTAHHGPRGTLFKRVLVGSARPTSFNGATYRPGKGGVGRGPSEPVDSAVIAVPTAR